MENMHLCMTVVVGICGGGSSGGDGFGGGGLGGGGGTPW